MIARSSKNVEEKYEDINTPIEGTMNAARQPNLESAALEKISNDEQNKHSKTIPPNEGGDIKLPPVLKGDTAKKAESDKGTAEIIKDSCKDVDRKLSIPFIGDKKSDAMVSKYILGFHFLYLSIIIKIQYL